ncbi:MAG: glycerol-3-phosphate acyltransferase [Dehalococcoidales bacterium]|nr:glycerol-3-phosphate acyltransferase [Dehalococcoidales bacterium]
MVIESGLLILAAYLLGSVPVSYLAARFSRGIDLRQYGTGQVGAGNLWRMTSWRLALPVGIFDFSKGMIMVWAAQLIGLGIAQQVTVGLAAIMGHNWSIFLRFNGGRGIGTSLGVIFVLMPWGLAVFCAIAAIGMVIFRSSPVPVLAGIAALPLVSWGLELPLAITLGFLAMLLIIVIKRLAVPRAAIAASVSYRELLLNRLLFDRDIRDKKAWMYRQPAEASSSEQPHKQQEKKG